MVSNTYNVHNTLVCTISFSSHNKVIYHYSNSFYLHVSAHGYLLKSILVLVIKKQKKAFLGIIYYMYAYQEPYNQTEE